MSERTSYSPGIPCWVALEGTPDIEASESFYRELFGWEMPELPNSAEMGGYRRAKLRGRDVAGVSPRMQDGQSTVWATYVSVADAAATTGAVREAGGQVIVEPMDVIGLGTMAVFGDPAGAVFGVWQPGSFAGAELVNEYGCFGWNELATRDVAAAREFYGKVFGWSVEEQDMGEAGSYDVFRVGDGMAAGMLDMAEKEMPDEVPPHWLVYFTVEDADAAIEKAKAGGGGAAFGPMDLEMGRFAVLHDQFGAMFAVMQPSEQSLAEMA